MLTIKVGGNAQAKFDAERHALVIGDSAGYVF